jgi:hypothetical protein
MSFWRKLGDKLEDYKSAEAFGGVAWAQNRGVRAVEVRIDDGVWQPAELGASYSNETWRLWSFPWQAKSPGKHTITVRATDNGDDHAADRAVAGRR